MLAGLRAGLLAVLVLSVGACADADRLTDPSDNPTDVAAAGPAFANTAFRGGIPIGTFGQPSSGFGDFYNGAKMTVAPGGVLNYIAEAKARGGKVMLMLAGSPVHYTGADGHFDMAAWKKQVDRFKSINFAPYINDGTIIGHFLLDEPNDPSNWNGVKITPDGVEEMAKFSKERWPTLPTIIRAEAAYFNPLGGKLKYLDAAWAQYVARKGTPQDYLAKNLADAQRNGMGLVVGLNITMGNANKQEMSAAELKSWGSTMLSSTYSCAFISWKYVERYIQRPDIQEAMAFLAEKARNRASKSCRGTTGQTPGGPAEPPAPPEEPPAPPEEPPAPPEEPPAPPEEPPAPPAPPAPPSPPSGIELKASGPLAQGTKHFVQLNWSGAAGTRVDLYRDNILRKWEPLNNGSTLVSVSIDSRVPAVFKVCEQGSNKCSNPVTVQLVPPVEPPPPPPPPVEPPPEPAAPAAPAAPPAPPVPPAAPEPPAPPAPPTVGIQLEAAGVVLRNEKHYAELSWSGASGSRVDLYRDGKLRKWTPSNNGIARVLVDPRRTSTFKVCELGTTKCSNVATLASE
jgi:hypothetical protein